MASRPGLVWMRCLDVPWCWWWQNVRAVFPDAGAAAMLRYQWGPLEIPFAISR